MNVTDPITARFIDQYGEKSLPPHHESPYFQVDSLFEQDHLSLLRKILSQIPGEPKKDGFRDHLITVFLLEVTYNEDGSVAKLNAPYFKERYHGLEQQQVSEEMQKTVEKTIRIVLERYGKELNLQGTHKIWMDCVRYRIPKDREINPLNWHKDPMTTWTMVNMLDDPHDPQSGWTGGDILLAPTCVKTDEETSEDLERMGEEPIPDESIKISHSANSAVFFHNYRTMHTVTPLKGKKEEKAGGFFSKLFSSSKVSEKNPLDPSMVSIRNIWTVFLWDDAKIPKTTK